MGLIHAMVSKYSGGHESAASACDAGNLVRLFRWRPLAAETFISAAQR